MKNNTQIKNINNLLNDKNIPEKLKKELQGKKDILLNNKIVKK